MPNYLIKLSHLILVWAHPEVAVLEMLQKKGSNRSQTSLKLWRDILIPTARVFSTYQGLLGSLSCTRVLIELASDGGSGEKCHKVSEILIFLLDSLFNLLFPTY